MVPRSLAPSFAALSTLFVLLGPLRAQDEMLPRNVLLIVADDVGLDRVEAFGRSPTSGPTPVLDLLADYGVIRGPVTTWPLAWDAVEADLRRSKDEEMILPVAVERARDRLLARAERESQRGRHRVKGRLSVAEKPIVIRGFAGWLARPQSSETCRQAGLGIQQKLRRGHDTLSLRQTLQNFSIFTGLHPCDHFNRLDVVGRHIAQ